MSVVVAPCERRAARYAVEHWHYSGSLPAGKLVTFGVWESDRFVGSVIFGRGASPNLGTPYGLDQTEVCELVRVACRAHRAPVSHMVSQALRQLRARNPGLRLVVSFADPEQGHVGSIYQAGNWIYAGQADTHMYRVHGHLVHPKSLHSKYGVGGQSIGWLRKYVDPAAERVHLAGKHRYVFPLDRAMRRRLRDVARPYPTERAAS